MHYSIGARTDERFIEDNRKEVDDDDDTGKI